MKCPLCGYEFNEQESKAGCSTCHILGACKMIRCPNCSYETPSEPKIIKRLKTWRYKDGNKQ
jgi:ribosomal protein S26